MDIVATMNKEPRRSHFHTDVFTLRNLTLSLSYVYSPPICYLLFFWCDGCRVILSDASAMP